MLDEINTLTTKKIMPGLADNFFKNGPMIAYMKKNRYFTWPGGPTIQENFLYKPLKGGAYAKGAQFDISKSQTKTAMTFTPKFYEVNVTEFKEDIKVLVKGPTAVMSMVKADIGNAALTMSAILEIAFWHHGQALPGDDRSLEINGIEEALNNGTTASWAGNTFLSYGNQLRSEVNGALNSPDSGGVVGANVNGGINYRTLEHSYQSCVIGTEHPKIGITSNRAMGFINENFQPQQRIDTVEPNIGFTGIKFKGATIVESQYIPSQDGVNDPLLGNYYNASELFAWLNPGPEGDEAFMKLFFAPDPEFQFGFTGFKPAQDSTMVSGQVLFSGQAVWRTPRMMRILYGITK